MEKVKVTIEKDPGGGYVVERHIPGSGCKRGYTANRLEDALLVAARYLGDKCVAVDVKRKPKGFIYGLVGKVVP